MARHVDPELLQGFIQEAKEYLPKVVQHLETLRKTPGKTAPADEAYRFVHTIKGASSMVGLSALSHMAHEVEEVMEEIQQGKRVVDARVMGTMVTAVGLIDVYLDGVLSGNLQERPLVAQILRAFRRLKGQPEDGDAAAVDAVMGSLEPTDEPAPVKAPVVAPRVVAAPVVAAAPDEPPKVFRDEALDEIVEAFRQEADEHLGAISRLLAELEKAPGHKKTLQEIRRSFHTLKGTAGMVGMNEVSRVAHRVEDLLDHLYEGSATVGPEVIGTLFAAADLLDSLVRRGESGVPSLAVQEVDARCLALMGGAVEEPAAVLELPSAVPDVVPSRAHARAHAPAHAPAPATASVPDEPAEAARSGDLIRVPLERLDDVVKLMSELVISRSAFEQHVAELHKQVDELNASMERLRRISHRFEAQALQRTASATVLAGAVAFAGGDAHTSSASSFDALEFDRYSDFYLLSRELTETAADLATVTGGLREVTGDVDTGLARLARLTSESHDSLMRLRMVPIATLSGRLQRTVRVTASRQEKDVELVLEGSAMELDKTVLEQMADPLLHLLRNAVDHGIEPPALRTVLGKPPRGVIRLRAYPEGTRVVLQIQDDGAGLDPARLRASAVASGLLDEPTAAAMSAQDLHQLVFVPGFSTAREVSEVSGRGVGMDIVKATVERMKGTVTLSSEPGRGLTTTIKLPMSLAVMKVLLVRACHETFAVPLAAVTQILRLERREIEALGKEPVVRIAGELFPVRFLGQLLRLPLPADETLPRLPVLVVKVGDERLALIVEQLLGGREVVVKSLGTHLKRVHGCMGATLLGDGRVVLILNPAEMKESRAVSPVLSGLSLAGPRGGRTGDAGLEVLVVDDSFSVRRVVSNLVKSAGWTPTTAKDGLEALEVIQHGARRPDVVLLDVEMPRMDGYELLATLRSREETRSLPVVMLTSRAGDKHRKKAMDLGASAYLVKPYRDEQLVSLVRKLAGIDDGPAR